MLRLCGIRSITVYNQRVRHLGQKEKRGRGIGSRGKTNRGERGKKVKLWDVGLVRFEGMVVLGSESIGGSDGDPFYMVY